ncbi:MAG: TIM-barrel domain-containing protein [Deinococcota bacterium]
MRITLGRPLHHSRLLGPDPLPWEHQEEGRVVGGPLTVTWQPAPLAFRFEYKGSCILEDHPQIAYQRVREGLRHTRVQRPQEHYYGLGEVSGILQRDSRRYRLEPRDACNYDPEFSDPLYKHIPLYLTRHGPNLWSALLYDQPHPMIFDFGSERHHYYGLFTYTLLQEAEYLRYAVVVAESLPELLKQLTDMMGRPELPPRWSLGYLASGMAYTDAPNPQERLLAFAKRVRQEELPCDGFHLSSGYTLHRGKRLVFCWNREAIPDPAALVAKLRGQGLRLIANVKPALLLEHPEYASLKHRGAFLRDQEGQPLTATFWGGAASWIDFTNPEAQTWWREKIQQELLDPGIDGIWNDNNEYAFDGQAWSAEGRPSYPSEQILGMAQASHQAMLEHPSFQDKRPFLISRSASLGVQRPAQTWTGDNTSQWKSLKFGNPIQMGLGLSGFAYNGSDVGGFYGEAPDPELFLRWVQQAVASPRFSIHSWKEPPTEPWSFPEVFPYVREALQLRYQMLPYLYSLCWQHFQTGAPIQRPLMYEFPELFEDPGFHALLGPFLLFPMVAEPGQKSVRLELPEGWYDWHTRTYYRGRFEYPTPLERVPLLVREGAIVPLGPVMPWINPRYDLARRILLFPHRGEGRSSFVLYEDDGETLAYRRGVYRLIQIDMICGPGEVSVHLEVRGDYPLPYPKLEVQVVSNDARKFTVTGDWRILEYQARSAVLEAQG